MCGTQQSGSDISGCATQCAVQGLVGGLHGALDGGGCNAARVERLDRKKSFQYSLSLKDQTPLTSVSFRTPPHMRLKP